MSEKILSKKLNLAALAVCAAFIILSMALGANISYAADIKVGEVTQFVGDVKVISGGRSVRIKAVPHPLMSTDKILTKDGRAEVSFVGGGSLRVNRFSVLEVEQRDAKRGIVFRDTVRSRSISVLIGELFFEVNIKRDSDLEYNVMTPSMTAAVRGSTVLALVGLDGKTKAKFTGHVIPRGRFEKHPTGEFGSAATATVNPLVLSVILETISRLSETHSLSDINMKEVITIAKDVIIQAAEKAQEEAKQAQQSADQAQQAADQAQQAGNAAAAADAAAAAAAAVDAAQQAAADAAMALDAVAQINQIETIIIETGGFDSFGGTTVTPVEETVPEPPTNPDASMSQ